MDELDIRRRVTKILACSYTHGKINGLEFGLDLTESYSDRLDIMLAIDERVSVEAAAAIKENMDKLHQQHVETVNDFKADSAAEININPGVLVVGLLALIQNPESAKSPETMYTAMQEAVNAEDMKNPCDCPVCTLERALANDK